MKINHLTREEVFRSLVTSEEGLTEEEAAKRLLEFGLNKIREIRKTPLSIRFLNQFTHFLAILLWVGAALAFLSEYLHPGEGMLTLGLAIVGVIFINAVFSFIQEYRAEKSIEALNRLLPFYVKVVREGTEHSIPAQEVVPGDLILLSEGDRIPADSRVTESTALMVNNAPLTGESDPVPLEEEACTGELIESRNIAFAGTTVVGGSGKAVVFATGMGTEFGGIAHLTGTVEAGLSPLQKEIIKVTRIVAALAVLMGIVILVIGRLVGMSFWDNFIFAIAIIVANVPEGLLPTVTLALAMGSQRMARKKALIKTLTSVETLGSVTVICTDKTGTLTQNRMEARRLWYDGKVWDAGAVAERAMHPLLRVVAFCNNAKLQEGEYRGDPTEVALLKMAVQAGDGFQVERIAEIPFDTERKRMTTIDRVEAEILAFTKGAAESLLPLCSHLWLRGEKVPMDESQRTRVMEACHAFMDRGLRVLAFAFRALDREVIGMAPDPLMGKIHPPAFQPDVIEKDLVLAGLIGLEDPPRPEVPEAIGKCRSAGIKVFMMTGDGGRTALAIAKEIGLVKGNATVIEGHEFARISDREFRERLAGREVIFARMTPKHKMRVVSLLKEEGERVAVTGDGVNDAPALKKADIGIAMGIAGADVAKEAADLILLDDNFATIVNAVEEGRTVYENIQKFITYIFAHLTPEIIPYVLSVLFKLPFPLTVMQILAIDLGTETVPALALGVERSESEVMKNPPRSKEQGLINRSVLFKGYLFLGLISTIGVLFVYFLVLYEGGWYWGDVLPMDHPLTQQAATATFLGIVIMQIGSVFACKTQSESAFRKGLFNNRWILSGILVEFLLSAFIVYHPWGNKIFATSPLSAEMWLILLPFAVVLFVAEETRKLLIRGSREG